jgi:hypothetical protein
MWQKRLDNEGVSLYDLYTPSRSRVIPDFCLIIMIFVTLCRVEPKKNLTILPSRSPLVAQLLRGFPGTVCCVAAGSTVSTGSTGSTVSTGSTGSTCPARQVPVPGLAPEHSSVPEVDGIRTLIGCMNAPEGPECRTVDACQLR